MGNGECKIPGGVGEARWDACKGVKERESRKKMIGGERKRKRCERERDIRGCEGGKGGMKDRNNGMKDGRTV